MAFVLVVAGVGLGRLGLGSRFLAVLLVLAFFALLTRFEPSVLRATAMAAVATGATFGGRAVSRPRVLALTVAALLLVDPILVHSVGFGLSVAATAGIVVLAARLEPRLPGPAAVREPAAVTLAAQVAVAPLLATVFGGVPLVSVPANLLAGPAAGFVMVWGLVAGPVAGFVPAVAPALHIPTGMALAWLDLVARGAAATPLGELRTPHLAVLAAAFLAAHGRPALRRTAAVVVLAVLATPGLLLARQVPLTGRAVATGAQVWRDGGAVVVRLDGRARAAPVLEGLRRLGVRRAGLVLLSASSPSAEATAEAVATRGSAAVVGPYDDPPSAGEGLRQGPFRGRGHDRLRRPGPVVGPGRPGLGTVGRCSWRSVPTATSGDAIEPNLEVVAGPNEEVLLVVPSRSDPQMERGILVRVERIGSPDRHVDHIDKAPPAERTPAGDAVDPPLVRIERSEVGVREPGAALEAVLLVHRDRDHRGCPGSWHHLPSGGLRSSGGSEGSGAASE